ncbi:MAG: SSS family solute:Na+ symporter [Paraglaciecola sp.]|jgi:SSS family solute:Na+ symporter
MGIDFIIVIIYFIVIFAMALSGRTKKGATKEEYFLSNRNLRWYSVAISSIATNINGYQFLGMMGSAYLYGLAQAQLEINAVQGIFMAAFIFVPMYLKDRVITITQFIKKRLGSRVALIYSGASLFLFSTIGIGAALFWGAYAAEVVFSEYFMFISESRVVRVVALVVFLGIFSAAYTYLGGLAAVVKTDLIQFSILTIGGIIITVVAVENLGGWSALFSGEYQLKWGDESIPVDNLMHLHLPNDHPQLPWTFMFGLFLLNINYWCANQTVVQRSLAARSLKEAQIGLMVGGVMKYFMAIIIIIPGIALSGILIDNPLSEPDLAYPYLVKNFIQSDVLRGIILCALFASLMSTVDSTFNSLATLFSIDIYKEYLNKNATDAQMIQAGQRTILVTLFTGVMTGMVLLYFKFGNPESAFTHTLNDIRYFINCGLVVLICSAVFLIAPKRKLVAIAFGITVILQLIFKFFLLPDMNYFTRALWVIVIGLLIVMIPTGLKLLNENNLPKDLFDQGDATQVGFRKWGNIFVFATPSLMWIGIGMIGSLVALHVIFH